MTGPRTQHRGYDKRLACAAPVHPFVRHPAAQTFHLFPITSLSAACAAVCVLSHVRATVQVYNPLPTVNVSLPHLSLRPLSPTCPPAFPPCSQAFLQAQLLLVLAKVALWLNWLRQSRKNP